MTKWTSRIVLSLFATVVLGAAVESSLAKVPEVKMATARDADRKPASGVASAGSGDNFVDEEAACRPSATEIERFDKLVRKRFELKSVVMLAPFDGSRCYFYFTKK